MSQVIEKAIKLLWVEDQAHDGSLASCTNSLDDDEQIDLTIISEAPVAEEYILKSRFDKIIFDLRILPGLSDVYEVERNNFRYKLGIVLIQRVFQKIVLDKTSYGIISVEQWHRIKEAILSIDPNFDPVRQFWCKDQIYSAEDIIPFIKNLK